MTRREPLRDATLELLIAWRQSLPPPEEQSEDERELTMNFEQIYERWEQKTLARGRREGEAKGKAEGKAEGKAQGKAEALLAVLDSRGLTVTAGQRKQVLGCSDPKQLDAWLRGAATTPSARALLSTEPVHRHRAK
jgi:flagellar biosynthesis/type III secretory pathway protein FliH